jgi:hypothetical protein
LNGVCVARRKRVKAGAFDGRRELGRRQRALGQRLVRPERVADDSHACTERRAEIRDELPINVSSFCLSSAMGASRRGQSARRILLRKAQCERNTQCCVR